MKRPAPLRGLSRSYSEAMREVLSKRWWVKWCLLLLVMGSLFSDSSSAEFQHFPWGVFLLALPVAWGAGWFLSQMVKLNVRAGYDTTLCPEVLLTASAAMVVIQAVVALRSPSLECLTLLLAAWLLFASLRRFLPRAFPA